MNRRLSTDRKSNTPCLGMYRSSKLMQSGSKTERKMNGIPSNVHIINNNMLIPLLTPLKKIKMRKYSDIVKLDVNAAQIRIRKALFKIQELVSHRTSTPY